MPTAGYNLDLSKKCFNVRPAEKALNKVRLKFMSVDTEELKDTEIEVKGNLA